MTLDEMTLVVAENIGQLSSDGSTVIDGKVTEERVKAAINRVYREEVFPLLSDRYPTDFEQTTYPNGTYTQSSTVNTVSGTTLTSVDDIFGNYMEGFEIENATQSEKIEIDTYTSDSEVEMVSSVDDWNAGDDLYVLGNVYTFGGALEDLKSVVYVGIKYTSSTDKFMRCEFRTWNTLFEAGDDIDPSYFSQSSPIAYQTTLDDSGTPVSGIGVLPYPTSYQGKVEVKYIEKPPAMDDDESPSLSGPGVGQILISGATSWAKRVKGKEDWEVYHGLYEKGKSDLVRNYTPKARAGVRARMGTYFTSIRNRS